MNRGPTKKSGFGLDSRIMKTLSRHNFVQMRALLIVLSVAFALAPSQVPAGTHNSVIAGETLLPLRTGAAGPFSYGLYNLKSSAAAASNAPAGNNLILMLRNTG